MRELIQKEFPFLFTIPAVLWQMLFFCIPLVLIVVLSFQSSPVIPGIAWTLDNYRSVFTHAHAIIIVRSLVLATSTALLCLIIGYPVAYFIALCTERWRSLLVFLVTLPFWTNFITLVYSWFFIVEKNGLINKILLWSGIMQRPLVLAYNQITVMCVMTYCFLPFMIISLYTVLEKLDKRLLEASADLGATPWQTFMRVTLPLSIAGIKTGLLLVFIPAFGEFAVPIIMGGSRYLYVGSTIMHYFMHRASQHSGAAFTILSSIILALSVYVALLYLKALYNTFKRR